MPSSAKVFDSWGFVAQFKARGEISYADCFALAPAKIKKAERVTGDREFKAFDGEVPILWL